jgi:hypothetical protein
MTDQSDCVATHSRSFPKFTFAKSGQLSKRVRVCSDPTTLVNFALEFGLVVHCTYLYFSLDLFTAIPMFACYHLHSLQHSERPNPALFTVWTVKFRFSIVYKTLRTER